MKKSFLLTLTILAIQASTAMADQRYDIICVTSPNVSGKVLVYDTLISTYAEEYRYDALTYLREADVFTVSSKIAKEASVTEIQENKTQKTAYKNADSPSVWSEKGLQTVAGARVVIATKAMITITDSETNKIQFKIPFIDSDLRAVGEIKNSNLVFNGQAVSTINYRVCGGGAD